MFTFSLMPSTFFKTGPELESETEVGLIRLRGAGGASLRRGHAHDGWFEHRFDGIRGCPSSSQLSNCSRSARLSLILCWEGIHVVWNLIRITELPQESLEGGAWGQPVDLQKRSTLNEDGHSPASRGRASVIIK